MTLDGAYSSSTGTLNIILGDGATLTINGRFKFTYASVNIYCQSVGTGKLVVSGNITGNGTIISGGTLTINGGTVEVTNTGDWGNGLFGNLVMNGGTATFTCNNYDSGDAVDGSVTLNGGTFTASSGDWVGVCSGTMTIADGKYFKDGSGNIFYGTLSAQQKKDIRGKTLCPATQTEYIQACLGTGNDGSASKPYTISNAAGWDAFCLALEDKATWSGFSGKTVKLGANITVNRIAGSGAGGNLTASDRPFCGTFDGGGNTLTFNYGSSGTPADENNLAPFRYVNNATIQHLHVAGNIYTQHVHSGGIIGMAYGTTNIIDCHSSVNIHSSINGDGTHGGIMSCSWTGSTTNITGCLFDGSIQSATGYTTDQCGGFVGWRNATINVKNCLLTADLSTIVDPEGLQYPSGTFVRNGVANTITNSYYTAALGTIQGKQVHSIKAGENVTVANAGTPEIYKTSGITSYGTGIMYDNVLYAGSGDNVSLTLGNTPPEGFDFNGYTTTGGTLTGDDNPFTLSMPDEDVTISAEFELLPVSVTYIDENGEEQTANALPLLGGGATTLAAGWYVVNSDISYTGTVTLGGDVHLILADGNTMTVTPANAHGIDVDGHALTIYGQTNGTGTLTATASGWNPAICAANSILNIHGGTINAIYNGTEKDDAINIDCWTSGKGLTITGGKVTADGGDHGAGIYIGGCHAQILGGQVTAKGLSGIWIWDNAHLPATLTLGCSKVTDFISIRDIHNYAGQEGLEADVLIADGQTLYDGTNIYSGTLTSDQISVLAGKTLRLALLIADAADNTADIGNYNGKEFAAVQLSGRTLFKDGAWNTLCLPFSMNAAQVTAQLAPDALMTLSSSSFSDGTLTMTFTDADEITAGKPYIIKWSGDGSDNLVNPTFTGVTISNATVSVETDDVDFIGTYNPTDIYTEEKTNLYLGDDNKLCYPNANLNINACRAYLHLLTNTSLGDVNGDGNINITDVIFMVNHILGQNNDDFIIANADMDQSGGIDIGDVVRLVNMILNPESSVKVTNVVSNVDITYDSSGSGSAR